jgi:hypothetical protein
MNLSSPNICDRLCLNRWACGSSADHQQRAIISALLLSNMLRLPLS